MGGSKIRAFPGLFITPRVGASSQHMTGHWPSAISRSLPGHLRAAITKHLDCPSHLEFSFALWGEDPPSPPQLWMVPCALHPRSLGNSVRMKIEHRDFLMKARLLANFVEPPGFACFERHGWRRPRHQPPGYGRKVSSLSSAPLSFLFLSICIPRGWKGYASSSLVATSAFPIIVPATMA